MYVINAPTVAVSKILERKCVICRFFDKRSVNNVNNINSPGLLSIPIDRIICIYKNVIVINNIDMFIPGFIAIDGYLLSESFGVVYGTIDFVEPFENGNVFVTLGEKGVLTYDEFDFMISISKDAISKLAVEEHNINYTVSTQLACLPESIQSRIAKYEPSILTEEHPEKVVIATSTRQPIKLQEVVERVKPEFLKERHSYSNVLSNKDNTQHTSY